MPALGVKLRIPTARRALVPRARLTEQLSVTDGHGGVTPRLVLVAAPAGFGKTTLLTQWLHATTSSSGAGSPAPRIAWLSLDAEDSDLRRFLTHLVAAVQAPDSTNALGVEAAQLLEADPLAAEGVLVSLINDLDTHADRMIIALDDYHVVDDAEVHRAVAFLLDNLPPPVTLAMTTRADPPLPVARLRARGELVEVRAADLRFTHAEATTFLNGTMGLHLEPDHVTALGERTEGWAAGLQLAALSARTRSSADDVAGFVESFSGSHRFVLDYLLDEVLSRHSEDVRTFLLATSVLTQLTAGLCDAVTGRHDSQQMLERLEAEGLFVVSLDEDRHWFRYHHLFADALRTRLPDDLPGRSDTLHTAASHWLADNGQLADAVRHAFAGRDQVHAAHLIELSLGDQRRRRQDPTLREWADRLDHDVVVHRPLLAAFVGWSRLAQGDVDGVEPWLDAAEAALATIQTSTPDTARAGPEAPPVAAALASAVVDRDAELRGLPAMISVYRAAVAQARGNTDGIVAHARHALEVAGPADHFSRGAANGFLGLAAWAAGDLTAAVDTFTGAIESLDAAGMRADALGSVVVLAQMWLARGDTHQACAYCENAIADATRHPGPTLPIAGDLNVGLADVLREQGDLTGAEHHLEAARQLGERASLPENRHRWYATAAAVRRARGDLDGALTLLGTAEELYLPGYFPDVRPIPAIRARTHLSLQHLDAARAWAKFRSVRAHDPVTYLSEYDLLTLARLLTATGDQQAAVALGGRVLKAAEAADRAGSIIEARLVRALAHDAAGHPDSALDDLGIAVDLGAPAGYCRLYLDEGPAAHRLLAQLAATSTGTAALAQRVLDASANAAAVGPASQEAPPGQTSSPNGVPGEALSVRELEVLHLLASELSGPDIARKLFVSVNTFRTHTRHIFTKLDVQTRRAAVHRASELGLL